jgi:hypothetical protein
VKRLLFEPLNLGLLTSQGTAQQSTRESIQGFGGSDILRRSSCRQVSPDDTPP